MASVDKTMFCFCHWGGVNEIGSDGSVTYEGGTTEQFLVKSGITFDEFKYLVFDRLGIEPLHKLLHFTVKFSQKQLIRLKDQEGVDHLIQFNDDFAHVYVTNDEKALTAKPVMDRTMLVVERTTPVVECPAPVVKRIGPVVERIAPVVTRKRRKVVEVEPNEMQSEEEEHASENHSASASVTTSCNDAALLAPTAWDEAIVGEGQAFENPDAFRQAVFKYANAKKFPYKYTSNTSKYMLVRCCIDGCQFKLTASHEASTNLFSIKKFVDRHSHSLTDQTNYKPQFRGKMVSSIIKEENLDCPKLPRELCNDSLKNFSIPLTYLQAWRVKEKVKKELEGELEDLFKLIPGFCTRLIELMPGTVATWSSKEDNTFKRLFVAYGCSIGGFHAGCRPLIFIDVRHLSGPPEGSLVVASSLDADNGMYPLAYGVVTSEDEDDWLWFLQQLKLVVRDREVVIVSDRNEIILSSVDNIFGADNHAHCYRHVQEIFNDYIDTNHDFKLKSQGKETACRYLNEIAFARTLEAYNNNLTKMRMFRRELYNWVIASGTEHWCNALFKKPRWDWLNSNLAESFSAWSEEESMLLVPKMMEAHCKRLSEILVNKKNELGNWKFSFGPKIVDKVCENQKVGHDLVATCQSVAEFEVQEQRLGKVLVNLKFSTCTCLEWQMTGIPCPHACRAIALAHFDVYEWVAAWYKKEVQELIYAEAMCDVSNLELCCPNEVDTDGFPKEESGDVVLSPRPPIIKKRPGRPRKNPIKPEVRRVKCDIRCSRCNGVGHNRKTCKVTL